MTRLGAREKLIAEVCDIIGHHHHPNDEESINFKIIYDADLIANIEEKQKESQMDDEILASLLDKSLLTESGRNLANRLFSQ